MRHPFYSITSVLSKIKLGFSVLSWVYLNNIHITGNCKSNIGVFPPNLNKGEIILSKKKKVRCVSFNIDNETERRLYERTLKENFSGLVKSLLLQYFLQSNQDNFKTADEIDVKRATTPNTAKKDSILNSRMPFS